MDTLKKLLTILLIIICLALSACDEFYGISHAVQEETGTVQVDEAALPLPSETQENPPSLPELDFAEMDFFEDGYEQVKYMYTIDGDTANFNMGGLGVKCRFIGIDTPELEHDGGKHEPYAEKAKDFTEKTLKSADVIILERDEAAGEYDNYDRLLAHVWADGELLSYLLVGEGLATTRYYKEGYKYFVEITVAESAAREAERGVWGQQ